MSDDWRSATVQRARELILQADPAIEEEAKWRKASNPDGGDHFGWSVALGGDGNTLAVGARQEHSSANGIDGDQADDSSAGSGTRTTRAFRKGSSCTTSSTLIRSSPCTARRTVPSGTRIIW